MQGQSIRIVRAWRSQTVRLLLFLILSPICIWLSQTFPASILSGPLFRTGESVLMLKLPLFWLIPAFVAFQAIIRIYDVKYSLDSKGLEAKIGILSLNQIIIRLRFEDIRSIDARQSLLDRILGIGSVDIGTAASAGLEMSLSGVANPLGVQRMIQMERDARIKAVMKKSGSQQAEMMGVDPGE